MGKKILVADDNEEIIKILKPYLSKEGFEVITAHDGNEALVKNSEYMPVLILLDIMMPRKNGLEVCAEIRKTSNVPIIMITARSDDGDKIMALDTGADDYIVKPFSPGEVVARVKAVLRRIVTSETEKRTVIKYNSLEIDIGNYSVKINDSTINLTKKEIEVLWMMANSPNKILSRDMLLDNIWGTEYFGDPRTVDTHIKRLRAKLKLENQYNWNIKTVWSLGYKFEVNYD
ncbi:response regulator transcription factor [Clostridium estertheticum]|uniref:response regulator transcription factor n=1 Tax=Clostridium estertheticum TaxID=238834 RepID=UPI001CF1AD67|nr:response regulator transcription factor [Clostridium estertheticum]MCB2305119.1 response regulator transcription factor [Clostridium estertheticum]MCB2343611.1 response regulator transcription factor [Clostridium estertheticum]MCB2348531.1 response regulator transcription factor [Clostridium estertheticum]WAG47475.1 response regulator transcription factor [Clostridium estertheticum]